MTSDLFHHFKTAANYGDSITSSAARAKLKVWDQRHESQPSWEEDFYGYESSEQVWEEMTCGQSVMGVDDCGILPEEKWAYIKNPRLTTEEVWQLCADESASDFEDMDDRYSWRDQYEMSYDEHYDWVHGIYDDDNYDDYYPCDYEWYESDRPSNVYYCYEMEQAAEKWIADAKVWDQTDREYAMFLESTEPIQPEPPASITDHHNRKNLYS